MAAEVRMGIYRHYKGHLYQVLGLAHDANHGDRTVVVYMPLELEGAHLGPRMAVRTIEDFGAKVHVSEARDDWPACPGAEKCPSIRRHDIGTLDFDLYDRTHQPRFTYLGQVLTAEMLSYASDSLARVSE